jgi:hypothetical protein
MELASRELHGYPGVSIELHQSRTNGCEVFIREPGRTITLLPETGGEALSMFYHPFAYGYNGPQESDDLVERVNQYAR